MRDLLRSSKPPPEGFRFRPRQRPLRLLTWLVVALQTVLILGLLWMLWQFQAGRLTPPLGEWLWLGVPTLLLPLLLGLSLHATWGAKAGEVVAPLQLWRWPELRDLPELSPLKPWPLLAVYGLPLLGMAALLYFGNVSGTLRQVQRWNDPEQAIARWDTHGWVRVSCAAIPLKNAGPLENAVPLEHTERSLCYMPTGAGAEGGQAFEAQLQEWLQGALTTFELSRDGHRTLERSLPDLGIVRGGGVLAAKQTVTLPHNTVFATTEQAYTLRVLARDSNAGGPLPNGWTEQQAQWLERQPFAGVLVLTPQ